MRKFIITSLTLAVFVVVVRAQDSGGPLTLKNAVQIALRNNVTLNTQRNNLFSARAQKASGIAGLAPQVYVNSTLYQSNGNRFIQQEGKVVNATVNGLQATLNVNQPIIAGLSGLYYMRGTSKSLDAQLEYVDRTREDVINFVANQYLQVLLDQELLKIAKENVEVQKVQLEQVKVQVELGSRSPVDEYNQQAQLSNAELRVAQAENTLVIDRTTLFQTMVIDPMSVTSIEDPSWDVNSVGMDIGELNTLVEQANQNRSDLEWVRNQEKANKFFWRASKGVMYPSLSAFYSNGSAFNQLKDANKADPAYRTFDQQFFTDNRSSSFGLSLYIPIINGMTTRYRSVQNRATYENSRFVTNAREVQVKSDVVKAYENFANVKAAYTAGVTGLDASKAAFDLEKERYNLGITTFVDFANANKTYIQAQTDFAQAKYRLLFQKILLDYALGDLTIEDIP